jgi:Zn-dependent protease
VTPASGIRIGRIFGISIYLHPSWFLIFALITLSLCTQFTAQPPSWSPAQHWMLGVITSLLFFGSVMFHELSHSLVAKHYKIPVASITLFVFGGLARIGREPSSAKQEFNIAIAGPISSFFLSNGLLLPSPFSAFWNACRQKIFNQMPVLDDGRVVGMIARDSILRVLQARLQVGHLAEQ